MHDFRGLFVWERLKTLVLFYPLALGVIVLLGWPTSYVLAAPASPPLPVWSVLLATLVAGYEVLRTAAHTASRPDDVQPADWIRYAHAPPVAVLAGKLLAAFGTNLMWCAVVTPLLLVVSRLAANPFPLGGLYGYWLLLAAALTFWGVWATGRVTSRSTRAWLLTGLWTVGFLAPLLPFDPPSAALTTMIGGSPARVVRHLAGTGSETPLSGAAVLYPVLLLSVTGLALAWLDLRRWAVRASTPQQTRPHGQSQS